MKMSSVLNNFSSSNCAKSILDECGLSYVWTNQYFVSVTLLYNTVKQIVINQFKQIWYSNLQSSPKALNYHMFREQLELEKLFKTLDIFMFKI
jgi:hypothetical protein